jgi:hypothetical protein
MIIGLLIAFVVAGHLLSRRDKSVLHNKDRAHHDSTTPLAKRPPTDLD